MPIEEIIDRLKRIANHSIHTVGEPPFCMSLDDGIAILEAIEILARQTGQDWISVKDRLPEERGRYLCWFGKNTFCVGADIATYFPEWHGFGILESNTVLQNITHWRPLPEPPEEVSGDD